MTMALMIYIDVDTPSGNNTKCEGPRRNGGFIAEHLLYDNLSIVQIHTGNAFNKSKDIYIDIFLQSRYDGNQQHLLDMAGKTRFRAQTMRQRTK